MNIILYSCNKKRIPSCEMYVNEPTTPSVSSSLVEHGAGNVRNMAK